MAGKAVSNFFDDMTSYLISCKLVYLHVLPNLFNCYSVIDNYISASYIFIAYINDIKFKFDKLKWKKNICLGKTKDIKHKWYVKADKSILLQLWHSDVVI